MTIETYLPSFRLFVECSEAADTLYTVKKGAWWQKRFYVTLKSSAELVFKFSINTWSTDLKLFEVHALLTKPILMFMKRILLFIQAWMFWKRVD